MILSTDTPTVLFSIEISARELDSKVAMASALAARGCRAVVGHKEAITATALASESVVWQGKGLFSDRSSDHLADRLIDRSCATMFHQDEGAMHAVNAWTENVLQKHYVEHIRRRDITRVCMWGQRQKDVFASHAPETEDRVTVTGSPRFDLCLPGFAWMTAGATEDIRARHAPYILVCTRFTAIAHAEGMDDPFRRKLNPKIWPESFDMSNVVNLWFSKWHRDVQDFAELVMLIKELAVSQPQRTVILRPHPSESLAFYAQAFSSFKNVAVTREGSVLPWIRAADLVVHSNCTTGIEAVLAGRPVINLLPAGPSRADTDVEVACEAGLTVGSVREALEKADRILSGTVPPHAWSPHAQSMLNNLKTEAIPLMAEETMRVLEKRRITSSRVSLPRTNHVRSIVRRLAKGPATSAYIASKRGPLDGRHVERLMEGCRSSGVGAGRISHATQQYVVIDPL